MKIAVLTLAALITSAESVACPEYQIAQKAMTSALYLETLNGGGKPLTKEIYSLNSQFGTYGIIFSYSGVQNIWKVKVDSERCLIMAVSKSSGTR